MFIGRIGKASKAFVSRTTVGFFKPSIKSRPTSKAAGSHQCQPQARQVRRQHRGIQPSLSTTPFLDKIVKRYRFT
jgi:hypothetical protein